MSLCKDRSFYYRASFHVLAEKCMTRADRVIDGPFIWLGQLPTVPCPSVGGHARLHTHYTYSLSHFV